MSEIILNGKAAEISDGETLTDLLSARGIDPVNIIAEFNGRLLTGADGFEAVTLRDGDKVDLFSMVGGG